jgi:hypothetical protein
MVKKLKYEKCVVCGASVIWERENIPNLVPACAKHPYSQVIHSQFPDSGNGIQKTIWIAASNKTIAKEYARDMGLVHWRYLSSPEFTLGINNCEIILLPGYENNRNFEAIKDFLEDVAVWGAAYGVSLTKNVTLPNNGYAFAKKQLGG